MNKLKELRIENNLLQVELAKKLKISQNGYSQYETETNDIPTSILKDLANFYNVSIDYLLCLTNIKDKYKSSKILKTFNNMNRLKEIRDDLDLNQVSIANIIGMSQTGYSAYETYFCDIPTKVLKKLALYYNVSIDYILYVTDERKPNKRNN